MKDTATQSNILTDPALEAHATRLARILNQDQRAALSRRWAPILGETVNALEAARRLIVAGVRVPEAE